MKLYVIPFLFSLFFISCGVQNEISSEVVENSSLKIAKAPINSTPIAINQKIVLEFSSNIDARTLSDATLYILDDKNSSIGLSIKLADTSNRVELLPDEYFKPSSLYTLVVTTDVKDIYENSLSEEYIFPFSTLAQSIDSAALEIRDIKPAQSATNVLAQTDIVIDFNKNLSLNSDSISVSVVDENDTSISGSLEVFNTTLKFTPSSKLPLDNNISVTLSGAMNDIYGNSFSLNKSWSFTTKSADNDTYVTKGFASLATLQTSKTSYLVRMIKEDENASLVVVARAGGIDFYSVNYAEYIQKPTLTYKSSFAISEKINDIHIVTANNLAISTLGGGLYHLKLSESGVSASRHYLEGENLYGITHASDFSYLFVVGPEYGLGVFTIDTRNEEIAFERKFDINETQTPLDVAAYNNELYIAGYSSGLSLYDENLSLVQTLDLNTSVKKVMIKTQIESSSFEIFGLSSSGKVSTFYNDAEYISNNYMAGSISDAIIAGADYHSALYVSMFEKGVQIHNDYSNYILDTQGESVSLDIVNGFESSQFILALNSDGTLNLFNAMQDNYAPYLYTNPYNLESEGLLFDANLSIYFSDDYLDTTTISKDRFTLKDETNGALVEFNFKLSKDEYGSVYAIIDPDSDLVVDNNYSLSVSSEISDMLGNSLEEPKSYKFNAVNAE